MTIGMAGATTIDPAGDKNNSFIALLSGVTVQSINPTGGEIITGLPTGLATDGAITALLPEVVGGKSQIG
jgi:hypothetical protein